MNWNKLLIVLSVFEFLTIVYLVFLLLNKEAPEAFTQEKMRYDLRDNCYDITKPRPSKEFVKVKVELLGSRIRQKSFLMGGIDYAKDGCFSQRSNSLTMNNYVGLYPNDSTIDFVTRFHSLGVVGNPYQFSIKLLDENDSILAKFPKDKEYAEGKIQSLSATIQIANRLIIPKEYRYSDSTTTLIVHNF